MTTLDFSSTAESSMDDDTGSNSHNHHQTPTKPSSLNTAADTTTNAARSRPGGGELEDNDVDRDNFAEDGGGGGEVWGAFTENFREVQSVLDRNRVLIQQVNENHRSKNHSNLVKNVALIQEINGNISKVVLLYSDLSSNFSSVFHSRDGGPQT